MTLRQAKKNLAGKVYWLRQRVHTPHGVGVIESFQPVSDGKTEDPGAIIHYGGNRRIPWKTKNLKPYGYKK